MSKILVVEDAQDLSRLIARELKACGYDVNLAEDGLSAFDFCVKQHPDLVILDWILPGMDGLEVLRRLRQTSATPVLMLTGRHEEIDRVLGLELGADDYLVKPFGMRELVARTRALLRRVELILQVLTVPSNSSISCGPLSLDPQTHIAKLNSREIDLSRIEFDLLHLFLRYPCQAFERSYLLETIWGGSWMGHDRSVDNVIHRLRRKLGEFGESIETVHGIGYRLRAN
jgi:DNA-binding response OmpR family regulator